MAINRDTEMDMMQAKRQLEHADLSESIDTPGSVCETACKEHCWIAKERDMLLEMTRSLECHPENYNGPCDCQTCMSYGD